MKMSDVFKLPVSPSLMGDDHIEQLTDCGDAHYCLEDSAYWMASNLEHIEHAAHAINHADALADALEAITSDYNRYTAIHPVDMTDDDSAKLHGIMFNASQALRLYRGAK